MKGGEEFSDAEVDELIRIADENGDGLISFEEFMAAALGKSNK
jgi:Ca2+-binding EF-hand superfamily protein